MAKKQEERCEELEGMKAHEVRTLALELGFSHKKALTKSQPELIEFILKKEFGKGAKNDEPKKKGKEAAKPSKDEKAKKRAAAGKKGKPKKKEEESEEDDTMVDDSGLGQVLAQILTAQKDLINRIDSLGSAVGEQGEKLDALVEAGKVNEAYNHVLACATDAIENKGDLEAAEAEVLGFVSGDGDDDDEDDEDDEGNED